GRKTQKILSKGHDKLSTYGIGKDRTLDEWRMLARSLLHQGLLEQTTDGYSVLKLNSLSLEVMKKQLPVSIVVPPKPKATRKERSEKAEQADVLFQRLRVLRKQLADTQSVPPYVIFGDSTLRLMTQMKPKNKQEFGQLAGVGSHKLTQYGDKFIAVIQTYLKEQSPQKQKNNSSDGEVSDTELQTFELHREGLSIKEIAQQRNLRSTTITRHLSDLIEKNQPVDLNLLVTVEKQKKIIQVLDILGDVALTPIKEYLGDSYSFDEIRLVRGKWRKVINKSKK
ncbi:MAG: helix-turn-helix domain-containing protein, partial [Cyanobacteria bacterium P01_D01_bin.116]